MMKRITKILIAAATLIGTSLQSDTVQHWIAGVIIPIAAKHPNIAGLIASAATILALAHNPKS